MLNRTGVKKETYTNVNQILFDVKMQTSVGIVVDATAGTKDSTTGKTIVKAGTPLTGDLKDRTEAFTKAVTSGDGSATPFSSNVVGILLHDVDVTTGDANGTLLIFGFVNLDRIDTTTQALIDEGVKSSLKMIQFLKG